MRNILLVTCCLLTFFALGQVSKIHKVGEEVSKAYESPHPYSGTENAQDELVWSQEIVYSGANYISVHFNKVSLSTGDFIIVKSPNNSRSWKYKNLNISSNDQGIWSVHIYGEKAIVEIHSKNKVGNYGYSIDKIARGYQESELQNNNTEAICGSDNSREAICYQHSEPDVYNKSRAVARLLINGTGACTGWLLGSDGHLMTNNHCIENANDANNVTVEFMAEGNNCNTNCQSWFGCAGTIEATSTTLIQTNVSLDYSLLKLPGNVSNTYGYMQLRNEGPVLNERIYIPQHPAAWGKRIALVSDIDRGGFPTITSLSLSRCTGGSGHDIGYFADTRGGSSGSPVISYNDHLVVALHHCANCPNRGIAVNEIISDLGGNLPIDATPSSTCIDNITFTQPIPNFVDQEVSNWIEGKTNNIIQAGANVTYDAGNQVRLKPGFRALNGSRFHALIDGCGGNAKLNSDNTDINEVENDIGLTIYPNPFSETANISYKFANEEEVSIYLFDSTGKRVVALAKNQLHQAGQHQLKIDARNLATGMYYLKLQSNENNIIKKLMIAK